MDIPSKHLLLLGGLSERSIDDIAPKNLAYSKSIGGQLVCGSSNEKKTIACKTQDLHNEQNDALQLASKRLCRIAQQHGAAIVTREFNTVYSAYNNHKTRKWFAIGHRVQADSQQHLANGLL